MQKLLLKDVATEQGDTDGDGRENQGRKPPPTLHSKIAGRADGPSLVHGTASEPSTVFRKGFADHETSDSTLEGYLEINGTLDLVVFPVPRHFGRWVSRDVALQGDRFTFYDSHVF